MKHIKTAQKAAVLSVVIISIVILATLSPLKGLSLLTWPLILSGIALWIAGVVLLIAGLSDRASRGEHKRTTVLTLLLITGFVPLWMIYMKTGGNARSTITVTVTNQSDFIPGHVSIYGTGTIFEHCDTLKRNDFKKGEKIAYVVRPVTKPGRRGFIRMELEVDSQRSSKDIAGEFTVNPYDIQQEWEVTIDNEFVK